MASTNSQGRLIDHMNEVAAKLLQSPPEALEALHKNMSILKHQLSVFATALEATTPHLAPDATAESLPPFPCRHNGGIGNHYAEIHNLLCNAAHQFAKARCQFRQLRNSSFSWLSQDARLAHLHPLTSSRHPCLRAGPLILEDRLLLLSSCMSLATDFQSYELSIDRTSKQSALTESIMQGRVPAVQTLSKHGRGFFNAVGARRSDYTRLDTALRLGMKLHVFEAIGQQQGLGSVLPLVLGFELHKLLRLPYKAFVPIKRALESGRCHDQMLMVADEELATWWTEYRVQYQRRFVDLAFIRSGRGKSASIASTSESSSQGINASCIGLSAAASATSTPLFEPVMTDPGLPFSTASDDEGYWSQYSQSEHFESSNHGNVAPSVSSRTALCAESLADPRLYSLAASQTLPNDWQRFGHEISSQYML